MGIAVLNVGINGAEMRIDSIYSEYTSNGSEWSLEYGFLKNGAMTGKNLKQNHRNLT
jgi:hypothetical protein